MPQPYLGEIRMFAGNFAPAGWMFCEGQLLPTSDTYAALFDLLGTTYGGDGVSTFGLPDLRGRVPLHAGNGFTMTETGGAEEVTLTVSQIPPHKHALLATSNPASGSVPSASELPGVAQASTITPYGTDLPTTTLNLSAVGAGGESLPHENLQPYLCINFIISLFGISPT